MKIDKKKIIIVAVCVAAVLVTVIGTNIYSNVTASQESVAYKETTVVKGNLTVGVTESGSVTLGTLTQEFELGESSTNSNSSGMNGMSGNSNNGSSNSSSSSVALEVEEVYVTVGQNVEEGQPLFKITEESIADYREELKDAVSDASASLNEAKLAAQKKQLSADYSYSTSVAKGNVAEATYNATIAQLQADIDSAQEDVTYYQSLAVYYGGLVLAGDTSYSDELEDSQEKYEAAVNKLTTAQNNYTTKSITAKKEYEETMLAYNNASSQYSIDVNGIDSDVDSASETLAEAKETLAEFEEFVGDGVIYSEYAGKLMGVGYAEGDTLSSDTAIAAYADVEAVTMTVSVSQEDIAEIENGDVVMIVLTAYPDEEFEGIVSGIDTSTSSGSSTVAYNVTVTFTGDVSKVYADMTGNVTFIQKQIADVIYVSNKAIINEGTTSYVKVKQENGNFEKVKVETGFSDGVNVEIVSGLEEGDIAIIESQVVSE